MEMLLGYDTWPLLSGPTSPGDSHMQDLYWVMHIWNLAPTELLSSKCIPNVKLLTITY